LYFTVALPRLGVKAIGVKFCTPNPTLKVVFFDFEVSLKVAKTREKQNKGH